MVSSQKSANIAEQKLADLAEANQTFLLDDIEQFDKACEFAPECMPQIYYLRRAGFPVYENTLCKFLPSGEYAFEEILTELKKATKYIFLEYFITQEGKIWNSIHDILKRKVLQGVLVRVLYDDIGSFLTLPKDFAARLEKEGIHCRVFNPFRPVLSSIQNNRDHRKIMSIDGTVAFTGGFNLADEYINEVEKHGH